MSGTALTVAPRASRADEPIVKPAVRPLAESLPPDGVQRLSPGEVPAGLSDAEWTRIQEQMRLAQYQVTWQVRDGAWAFRAPNPAQGFDTAFAPDGFTASAYVDGQPTWRFGLRLTAYGDQAMPGQIAPGGLIAHWARVEYCWTEGVTERYENTPDGSGGLRLRDASGTTLLRYDGLAVTDATGRLLLT